jgi:hypothetical protein
MANEQFKTEVSEWPGICDACATQKGWRWPPGHAATTWPGHCTVCGDAQLLTNDSDWVKGKQRDIPTLEWD